MLRVCGCDEVEWHVGRPTDVLVWKSSIGAFVMTTHDSLAHKTHASHYEDREDDADDWADGAGVTWKIIGWWWEIAETLVRFISAVWEGVALLLLQNTLAVAATELIRQANGFTVLFIGAVCAVRLSIAAHLNVHTLAFVTLKLQFGADGTVHLVTVVCTFSDAVTAPRHGDTVNLTGSTGKLFARTGGRLSAAEQVLKQHQMHGTRAARRPVTFSDADV